VIALACSIYTGLVQAFIKVSTVIYTSIYVLNPLIMGACQCILAVRPGSLMAGSKTETG
jgi:hypothetical protein